MREKAKQKIVEIERVLAGLDKVDIDERVEILNEIKIRLKEFSPFKTEPVDCVIWVKNDAVVANAYNPNSVAPPEMRLLEQSILQDGYTQPIVSWKREDDSFEVVDGFHRNRVGKECKDVNKRIHGYLPLAIINSNRQEIGDRMASTIRHNRARGKHSVDSMSDIVLELKKRNRSDSWIAKNLGMDEDEILRLTQISGLADLFKNADFSSAWDVDIFDDVLVDTDKEAGDEIS
jgi:ParB-like chromosome segregation protein Spo0J